MRATWTASRSRTEQLSLPKSDAAFSPDGRSVAFSESYEANVLRLVDASGGESRDLSTGASPAWLSDGQTLLFFRCLPAGGRGPSRGSGQGGSLWAIEFLPFGAETPVQVAELGYEPAGGYGFSRSADGRWALSTETRTEADLMLVEDFR